MNVIDCHPSKQLEIARAIELGDHLYCTSDRRSVIAVTAIDVRQLVWSNGSWIWVTLVQTS